jgi:prepilin-type N-terminal cleavage/methylation domain-containing protein
LLYYERESIKIGLRLYTMVKSFRHQRAFSLAELLIVLAVLGIITTFTVPKILNSYQNTLYNAIGKEAMGSISQAFLSYRQDAGITANFKSNDMVSYFNGAQSYTGMVDGVAYPGDACFSCASRTCLLLNNGAVLVLSSLTTGGTTNIHATRVHIDPKMGCQDNNNGHTVWLLLYYNGKLTSAGNALPGTISGGFSVASGVSALDPAWFKP